mgnify:CR=1 FL=1
MAGFDTYLSPLTWRYGSDEMRRIWSQVHQRRLWRRVWVALAEAQAEMGLVTLAQAADLRAHADEVNLERSLQIEAEIKHDVVSEIRAFAEQCPVGGGIIHLGATSMDVRDNATALQARDALDLLPANDRVSPDNGTGGCQEVRRDEWSNRPGVPRDAPRRLRP